MPCTELIIKLNMDSHKEALVSEWAHKVIELGSDKQAEQILLLDVRQACSFADYFVIMTAITERHIDSLAEDCWQLLKTEGAIRHHREGSSMSGWLLLDFGDLIVHLLSAQEREFYRLEEAWSHAKTVVMLQ